MPTPKTSEDGEWLTYDPLPPFDKNKLTHDRRAWNELAFAVAERAVADYSIPEHHELVEAFFLGPFMALHFPDVNAIELLEELDNRLQKKGKVFRPWSKEQTLQYRRKTQSRLLYLNGQIGT